MGKGSKQAKAPPAAAPAQADGVRGQFIRFAIAFLRSNDAALIQDLLQVRTFIPEVRIARGCS